MSGSSPFNSFIQTELPKRATLMDDADQETVIIRRGAAARQVQGLALGEGQIIMKVGGQLRAVSAGGLSKGLDVYIHTQEAASTSWVIAHDKAATRSVVTCLDLTNKVILPEEIETLDENTIKVTFTDAVAGSANVLLFNE